MSSPDGKAKNLEEIDRQAHENRALYSKVKSRFCDLAYIYIRQNVGPPQKNESRKVENLQREHDPHMKTIAPTAGFSLIALGETESSHAKTLLFTTGL